MSKNIIICFLGVDGSGKSTLSNYLYEHLQNQGFNVTYIWWLEAENSLLRKIMRKIGNLSSNGKRFSTHKKSKKSENFNNRLFKTFYPKIVLLNYIIFGIQKIWLSKIGNNNKIIILDRYYYDVILALSEEFGFDDKTTSTAYNLFKKLFQDPDLVFIIDIPPEISYIRKKEEIKSIKNAKLIKSRYEKINSLLNPKKTIKVDNSTELNKVKSEILKITLANIGEIYGK